MLRLCASCAAVAGDHSHYRDANDGNDVMQRIGHWTHGTGDCPRTILEKLAYVLQRTQQCVKRQCVKHLIPSTLTRHCQQYCLWWHPKLVVHQELVRKTIPDGTLNT